MRSYLTKIMVLSLSSKVCAMWGTMRKSWTLRTTSAKHWLVLHQLLLPWDKKVKPLQGIKDAIIVSNGFCTVLMKLSKNINLSRSLMNKSVKGVFVMKAALGKRLLKSLFQVTAGLSCLPSLRKISLSEALVNPQRVIAIPENLTPIICNMS